MYKFSRLFTAVLAAAMILSLFALSGGSAGAAALSPGAVFVLTNASGGNAVAAFNRAGDGSLTPAGTFATGGLGTGAGLGSQSAVILSANGRRLFAVNAGSNDISVFAVRPDGLEQLDKVASGGSNPISLTAHGDLLYVLNAGAPANISGFRIEDGTLSPLAGSTRPLSASSPGPAEVAFSPDGGVLVVTEKSTNEIDTYTVDKRGLASGPTTFASNGATPFGFAFDKRGHLIVSEAGPGAVSSYSVSEDGILAVISPSVIAVGQQAACWVAVTKNGRYAYTANAHSGTVTGYGVAQNGSLSLLNANGITGITGGAPLDMGFSRDSQFLYVVNSGLHTINAFKVQGDGSLVSLANAGTLPASASGIAAW